MEIERINENTIKFYISYLDIEDLGYEKEDIWYNRERSEQLFWHMMDEVNQKEDFSPDGPLWIQVQAMEKGLEIIVTKAKISKQDDKYELDDEDDDSFELHGEEDIDEILEDTFGKSEEHVHDNPGFHEEKLWVIVKFADFEDVIQLSHLMKRDYEIIEETLYHYEGAYYLYVQFGIEVLDDDNIQTNLTSKIHEFATNSDISLHVLEEYGKKIIEENTFAEIRKYFPREK
ncbi:adaptor protein MecA [Oceanobacillus alkalisoli]|uniref:adaptor protein MecA n=1 Tax=Oceanobacillus alkalisoli TaxID=2925113 RepID=UPI001EE44F06|nr:adaptor protein MecA [Oceanobacillus alkalisoli]MCG5105061.1 adaptor protein MecA [Oceanobacillus alkalisoli]